MAETKKQMEVRHAAEVDELEHAIKEHKALASFWRDKARTLEDEVMVYRATALAAQEDQDG